MSDFICLHTPQTLFTNRLYVGGENLTQDQMENYIDINGQEKKGLGMTEYRPWLGKILSLFGVAFASKDEHGNKIFINKKSFCTLILRLKSEQRNRKGPMQFNSIMVEKLYNQGNINQNALNNIISVFKNCYTQDKDIAQLSLDVLQKCESSFTPLKLPKKRRNRDISIPKGFR